MGKLVKISATLVAMVFLIALVGCDEPTDTPKAAHNHVWSDWKHDTTKHWKECSCGTKTEEGNHAFENNKCKTCGYDKTIAVTSVTLSEKTLTLAAGGTKKLSAVVKPDNASSKTVTWESSNKAIATVGTDGTVTAVVKGEAIITAKAGDQKAECAVIVTNPTPAQPAHTHKFEGSWKNNPEKHWKECTAEGCDNPKAISEEGAHTYNMDSETPNKCAKCGYIRTVAVENVTLQATLTLKKGATEKLTATIAPANASNKTVTWKSSNEDIAKVDQSGNVEAMGEGTATITAEADGKKGECSVTVKAATPSVSEHQHVYGGEWRFDETEHWKECTAEGCSDPVQKIEKEAHDFGTSNICSICGCEKVIAVTNITLPEEFIIETIGSEGKKRLKPTIEPGDATGYTLEWTLEDNEIATVNEEGVVTGVVGGKTKITVRVKDSNLNAECFVIVLCAKDSHDYKYTPNGDKHVGKCEVCSKESEAEDHQIESGVCTKCGAHENISYEISSAYVNDKPLVGNTEYTTELIQTFKKSIEVVIGETKDSVTLNFNKSKRQIQQILDANSADESKNNPIYLVLETNIPDTVEAGDDTPEAGKFVFTDGYSWDEAYHSFNFKDSKIMLWLSALKDKMEIKYQVDLGKEQTITIYYKYKEDDTVKIATIIKGISDVKTMEGANLQIYQNNLNKYDFVKVETLSNGNYEVTCEVNVTELQKAPEGTPAAGEKNILAVVALNKIEGFTIGNISRNGVPVVGANASWVTDAPKFVKNADEEKYTYVTLWMSMEPGDDGNIPDRTYKIKAYAGDENPKTLTFKFIDKPSEVSSFEELKTAVGNDYANIKLVENITLPETLVISNNATIDLNGKTISKESGASFTVVNSEGHSSMIYIGNAGEAGSGITDNGAFKVTITDTATGGKIDAGNEQYHAIYAQNDANVTLSNIEVTTSYTSAQAALVRANYATIILNSAKVTAAGYGSSSAMVKTDEIGKVYIIGSEITGKGIGIMNWGTATIEKSQITVDTPLNKAIMALSYDGKISTVNVKESTIEGKIAYGAYAATDPTPIVNVDAESTLKKFSLFVQYDKKSENNLSITIAQSTDVTLAEDAIKEDKIADTYLAGALKNCTNVKDSEGKLITVDEAGNVESSE